MTKFIFLLFYLSAPAVYAQNQKTANSWITIRAGFGLYSDINGKNYAEDYGGFFAHGYGGFIEAEIFQKKKHSFSLMLDVSRYNGINKSLPGLAEYYRGEVITPAILYNRYFKLKENQNLILSTGIAIEYHNYNLLRTDPPGVLDSIPEEGFQGTGGFPIILKYEYTLNSKWILGGRVQTYILIGLPFPSVSIMPYIRYQFIKSNK